jgi:hypothetical protein
MILVTHLKRPPVFGSYYCFSYLCLNVLISMNYISTTQQLHICPFIRSQNKKHLVETPCPNTSKCENISTVTRSPSSCNPPLIRFVVADRRKLNVEHLEHHIHSKLLESSA